MSILNLLVLKMIETGFVWRNDARQGSRRNHLLRLCEFADAARFAVEPNDDVRQRVVNVPQNIGILGRNGFVVFVHERLKLAKNSVSAVRGSHSCSP
jgi:hypothetical protein